jgi:hypothetical protein
MSRVSTSVMTASGSPWVERLERWSLEAQALAAEAGQDPQQLLLLLRSIEQLHRDLQDGPFRASLPSDRRGLHDLLQSMERSGGWPYIPRLQLKTFMELLEEPSPPVAREADTPGT